jgi:hypothetical protein
MPTPRKPTQAKVKNNRARGGRAEDVASWYVRLNGFLSIPGFIVHLDTPYANFGFDGRPRHARTEADLLAVRFPFSREIVGGRQMADDERLLAPSLGPQAPPALMFALIEVKAGRCRMNGPWTDANAGNMQRVVRRFGIGENEEKVEAVAAALYERACWRGDAALVQYICIGGEKNPSLQNQHIDLIQIDWRDIGSFLHRRFSEFPEKLPNGYVHDQWPSFGRAYGNWFVRIGRRKAPELSGDAVHNFVESGTLDGFIERHDGSDLRREEQ